MCMWKNRAGQNREETKVSDRFTSKDLSSCSSEPEGGEEGETGLADNWLDILFLTSSLQSPEWFECHLPWRWLLPLMFLQHSQALQAFKLPRAEEWWYLPVFRGTGMGLATALGCASSDLWPRSHDMTPCHVMRATTFLWHLLHGRDMNKILWKKRSGAFLLLIFILHLLPNQP